MANSRQSFGRLVSQLQSSPYVCKSCRTRLALPAVNATQRRTLLFDTEKVRRKIWGTDNPPGLKDPYGGPGVLERRFGRPKESEGQVSLEERLDDEVLDVEERPSPRQVQQYKEAETWDGLQHIGTPEHWSNGKDTPQDKYEPWLNPTPSIARSRSAITFHLFQAMVECLSCKTAGVKIASALRVNPEFSLEEFSEQYKLVPSSTGGWPELQFVSDGARDFIHEFLRAAADGQDLHSAVREAGVSGVDEFSAAVPRSDSKTVDEHFLAQTVNLNDPIMFTVLKRFAQLSGQRIPDRILGDVANGQQTLAHLVDRLSQVKPVKPKKVAEVLQDNSLLAGQGNVWVIPRKYSMVDKEIDVGRWKVIEQELRDRGLTHARTSHRGR